MIYLQCANAKAINLNIAHIEKYQRTQQQVVCYLAFGNAIVLKTATILTVQNLSWEVVAYQAYHRCMTGHK